MDLENDDSDDEIHTDRDDDDCSDELHNCFSEDMQTFCGILLYSHAAY